MNTLKKLDPRLRRLIAGREARLTMEMAAARGEVTASAESLAPHTVTKRVLIELNSAQPRDELANMKLSHIAGNVFSADVPLSRMDQLNQLTVVESVEAGRKWYPFLDTSLAETHADIVHAGSDEVIGRSGTGVVVGIIDFGLDFTLDDFRNSDGTTRLAFIWDQSLTPTNAESAPANFAYGVEYDASTINQALLASDPFDVVRHGPGVAAHGTHVAGIAAGNGRSKDADFAAGQFVGAAPDATIVFVQPDRSDQDNSFTDSTNVADAVAYIFEKADRLRMPCVVNMSLGQNGGSHDGESIVERAIDRLLEQTGRAFISAAGNEHVWRGHASGQLSAGDTRTLKWKVGGGMPVPGGGMTGTGIDLTSNEMEIWYSSRDRLRISVIDPHGNTTKEVEPDGQPLLAQINATTRIFVDSERFTVFNGDSRIYIQIEPSGSGQSVTPGIWKVRIEALEADDGRFDAWIERDAREPSNNFADQSFFVGTDFDPVRTLGTPATARRSVAVANYNHRLLAPNDSSSRGPTRTGLHKPEIAAPGTGIFASCSLGGRPNGLGGAHPVRVEKSGTSMAAPHVAGIVALMMEELPDLSSTQISKILKATANDPDETRSFDLAWGYGRVDARRAIALLRNPNQPGRGTGTS